MNEELKIAKADVVRAKTGGTGPSLLSVCGVVALATVLGAVGGQVLQGQHAVSRQVFFAAPQQSAQPVYETRQVHDPNGTGSFTWAGKSPR